MINHHSPANLFPPFFLNHDPPKTKGDENAQDGLDDVEWEDNWDDEVEGENEFAKRLRAELERNKDL